MKTKYALILATLLVLILKVAECIRKLTDEESRKVYSDDSQFHNNNLTEELVAKIGYPLERHTVVTEDGYILVMHRIPYSPKNKTKPHSSPILLLHPMIGNSMIFLFSEKNSPGYVYSAAGYDVWLSNCRGTHVSNRHLTLDPTKNEYWYFSWHEVGYYDFPAMIDYIIDKTGFEKIFVSTYSMGGTAYMAGLASRPEYSSKIKAAVLVAPAVKLTAVKRRAQIASNLNFVDILDKSNARALKQMLQNGILTNFAPRETVFYNFGPMCQEPLPVNNMCLIRLCARSGCDIRKMDPENTIYLLKSMPDGVSHKMLHHYSQICSADRFQNYDYSSGLINMKKYGSVKPPVYNLTKITVPAVLIWSHADAHSPDLNANFLKSHYGGKMVRVRLPEVEKFDHFSFAAHKDLKKLVYGPAIKLLKKYL